MGWEDLLAERDQLLALFEEAPASLSVCEGPELRVTRMNRRVRELMPDLLGKSLRALYPATNPIVAALGRVYATGVPETVHELPAYFPNSALADRFFTRRFVPLRDAEGHVYGVFTMAFDVTDEVRARNQHLEAERRNQVELQRLSALFEEAPALINVLEGPELRVVMSNRRTREAAPGRDLLGVSMHDLVPPTNPTLQAALRVYETGVPETYLTQARDVEEIAGRWFSSTIVPIRDEAGNITRLLTLALDITESRQAQAALEDQARALEEATRQAQEASRAKDEFLAMLGHELRNPLAPIVMTLELMRQEGTTSAEVELLARQVRHLVRLVDDLLDVSRIARGLVELKCCDVKLPMVVNRALEMTGPLIEQRGQRVISDLGPAMVHGDPDRLAQVVANLITNAAKYSEVGTQIRIRTESAGGLAKVSVADDGVGIAPAMLGDVFDAFVQQRQTLARSEGGLGLGLAIVKGLVEAHQGRVFAHSDGVGKGSTFVIELPAISGPIPRPHVSGRPEPLRPLARSRRVLVVDDNRDAAFALKRVLEALGQVVAVAHDAPSALREATRFQPEVALLDIGLPGMDGYGLAAELRAPDLRLVAITGYGQPRDRVRSRDAGFEHHLVKPVDIERLAALLE
jgi:signal transduction histidine kinase